MVRPIVGLAMHNLLLRPGEGRADFPKRKRQKKLKKKIRNFMGMKTSISL